MTPHQTPAHVDSRDDRELDSLDSACLAIDDAEAEIREEVQLIDILDEMTEIEECMLMNRLLMNRKNAAHDVHEILSGALDRAVTKQAAVLLKKRADEARVGEFH
jgi:hypothetical protein